MPAGMLDNFAVGTLDPEGSDMPAISHWSDDEVASFGNTEASPDMKIYSNGSNPLLVSTTCVVHVGKTGTPGTVTTAGDVFMGGALEVDGNLQADGGVTGDLTGDVTGDLSGATVIATTSVTTPLLTNTAAISIVSDNEIHLKPSADADDYLTLSTVSHVVTFTATGASTFNFAQSAAFAAGATFGGAELVVGASNVLHLGASGGTPGSATNSGDVYVHQRLEVNGPVDITNTLDVSGTTNLVALITSAGIYLKEASSYYLSLLGSAGADQVLFCTHAVGGHQICFTDYANRLKDHDHVVQTYPTTFHQSDTSPDADNRQWGATYCNQAAFVSECGFGYHYFPLAALEANATMTFTANPTTDDGVVFSINTTTLTGKTSGAGANEFDFGATLTLTLDAIVAAINTAESGTLTCHKVGTTMIVFEVDATGTAGNAYVTTETTDTDGVYSFGGATFSGGRAAVTGSPGGNSNHYFPGALEVGGALYVAYGAAGRGVWFGATTCGINNYYTGLRLFGTGAQNAVDVIPRANYHLDFDEPVSADAVFRVFGSVAPTTRVTQHSIQKYNQFSAGDYGSRFGMKFIEEEVTVAVGTGNTPIVVSTSNLAPAGCAIFAVSFYVTQAPGGGATTLSVGITGGAAAEFVNAASCNLITESALSILGSAGDGSITGLKANAGSATTFDLTTDADVTGTDMKVRITVGYFDFSVAAA